MEAVGGRYVVGGLEMSVERGDEGGNREKFWRES